MQLRFSHDDSLECVHFQRPVGCFYVTWPRLGDCARPGKVLIYKKDFGTVCFTMTMTRSLGKLPIQRVLALAVFEGHGNFPHRHFCRQLRKHALGTLFRTFLQMCTWMFHVRQPTASFHKTHREGTVVSEIPSDFVAESVPRKVHVEYVCFVGVWRWHIYEGTWHSSQEFQFWVWGCIWMYLIYKFILFERKNWRIWTSGSYDFGLNSH